MDRPSSLHALRTHGYFHVVLRPATCSLPQVCCGRSGLTLQASLHVRLSPVPWVTSHCRPGAAWGMRGAWPRWAADTSIRGRGGSGTEESLRNPSSLICSVTHFDSFHPRFRCLVADAFQRTASQPPSQPAVGALEPRVHVTLGSGPALRPCVPASLRPRGGDSPLGPAPGPPRCLLGSVVRAAPSSLGLCLLRGVPVSFGLVSFLAFAKTLAHSFLLGCLGFLDSMQSCFSFPAVPRTTLFSRL